MWQIKKRKMIPISIRVILRFRFRRILSLSLEKR
uniref:Uncharacterized protein n=1 Tax=Lepeophtheirus salmonis TaxID=72036 RepID=A0A0K2TAW2_LEPSM